MSNQQDCRERSAERTRLTSFPFCRLLFSTLCMYGFVPTTTYGENIGVMAMTKVYSVQVIGGAAVISICPSLENWQH